MQGRVGEERLVDGVERRLLPPASGGGERRPDLLLHGAADRAGTPIRCMRLPSGMRFT
ncbi:hypothetical protein H5T55_06385 [Candidatus Bipolaricaulota bacterium]|nr:hypothetical protein [Candidatus Bipolaricaulota bacterium]